MAIKKITLLFSIFLLSACNSYEAVSANNNAAQASILQTRVFIKNVCPLPITSVEDKVESASVAATLAGILAPKLIESGLDILGTSITKAAGKDDKTTAIEAKDSNYFYEHSYSDNNGWKTSQSSSVSCIVFVMAHFGSTPTNQESTLWLPEYEGEKANQQDISDFNIQGEPIIYLQADLRLSDNNSHVKITPNYLWYGKKLNPKGRDAVRDLQIHFSFINPSLQKNNLVSTGSIELLKVKPDNVYGTKELAGISTGLLVPPPQEELFKRAITDREAISKKYAQTQLLAATDPNNPSAIEALNEEIELLKCQAAGSKPGQCDKKKAIRMKTLQLSALRARLALPKLSNMHDNAIDNLVYGGAFDLNVKVIETRDINQWLVALGEAISSSKSELASEISTAVIPSLKQAKKNTELASNISKQSSYLAALADVDIAQQTLTDAESKDDQKQILLAQKGLVVAKMTANSKALDAGQSLPYPELL